MSRRLPRIPPGLGVRARQRRFSRLFNVSSARVIPCFASVLGAVFLLFSLAARADDLGNFPEGPDGGMQLAAVLRNLRPDDAHWKGDLKIQTHSPDGRVTTVIPASGESSSGDTQWRVTYTTAPTNGAAAEQLTVVHAADAPSRYLYARAASPSGPFPDPKSLAGADAEIPFAGSDFWLADVGFEFYHWSGQRLLKPVMRRGRPCFVIESTDPNPPAGGYSKVVSYIDREAGVPIEAEAYGTDGKLLKEFALGRFKKVNGRWELKRMEIDNDRTGSRTLLEFDLDSPPAAK
jgi:hypothetical protein